jgi:hypothetical protein
MGHRQVPSVEVGNSKMYIDNQGNLHKTPEGAITENQRTESDFTRGAAGGCSQDATKVPLTSAPSSSDPSPKKKQ